MKTLCALSMAVAALFSGCHAFNAAIDCPHICQRYHDCFDSNYDVSGCSSRCQSSATSDENYYRDVDTCDACITDRDCTDATFNCSSSCTNVVP